MMAKDVSPVGAVKDVLHIDQPLLRVKLLRYAERRSLRWDGHANDNIPSEKITLVP